MCLLSCSPVVACADQAAELVPISLSTAMAHQQAGSKLAALYNDGNETDLPALYNGDEDDPVRNLLEPCPLAAAEVRLVHVICESSIASDSRHARKLLAQLLAHLNIEYRESCCS